jgi:glutamine synthetase
MKVLDDLENVSKGKLSPEEKTELKLNVVGKIPEILLDNTDRNRTSPFAFTGNKFEFRAVGSSANCANPMIVLNTIVAHQLQAFKIEVDKLIKSKKLKKDDAVFNVLREYIKQSRNILFEGDGYSDSWAKEAQRRGLSNTPKTPDALKARISEKTISLFGEMGVMNKVEVQARYEVQVEEYIMRIQIESRVLGDIARNHIIPTAVRYQNTLIENVSGLKAIYGNQYTKHASEQLELIEKISAHIANLNRGVTDMINARKKANAINKAEERAQLYCNEVLPFFEQIRYHSDRLELMVDDELWSMVKYRELLFLR